MTLIEAADGLGEVSFADDVVPLENRSGLVPGHLHGDALGDAGTHQVAHGGSPQVVGNPTRTTRLRARRSERLEERRDPLPLHFPIRPVEHPRADHVVRFQPVVLGLLRLQELLQGVGKGERPPLVILRRMPTRRTFQRLDEYVITML